MPRLYDMPLNFLLYFTLISSRAEVQVTGQMRLGRVDEVAKRMTRDLLCLVVEHVPGAWTAPQ